jgi:anti-sigma regulatory factor (Ser/Thr protein kinase)
MERWLPRSLDALDDLFRAVDDYLATETLPQKTAFAARLVAEELFTNLIRHNRGGRDQVHLSIERRPDRLVIRFDDFDVAPFDPASTPVVDAAQPLAERAPGGLGVHLVKNLFDELHYEYRDGVLRVTASKRLESGDV